MITLELSDELLDDIIGQLEKETLIKLIKESNIKSQVYSIGNIVLNDDEIVYF